MLAQLREYSLNPNLLRYPVPMESGCCRGPTSGPRGLSVVKQSTNGDPAALSVGWGGVRSDEL